MIPFKAETLSLLKGEFSEIKNQSSSKNLSFSGSFWKSRTSWKFHNEELDDKLRFKGPS